MLPMRDDDKRQLKIELLSQWKLEAESRNSGSRFEETDLNKILTAQLAVAGVKDQSSPGSFHPKL